jgi:hypothetical protein
VLVVTKGTLAGFRRSVLKLYSGANSCLEALFAGYVPIDSVIFVFELCFLLQVLQLVVGSALRVLWPLPPPAQRGRCLPRPNSRRNMMMLHVCCVSYRASDKSELFLVVGMK